jgi:hypothetical protein
VPQMIADATAAPLTATTSFLILTAQVVALILLFAGSGRGWFKRLDPGSGAVV